MKGWKTLLFAIVGGVLGTLEAFDWANLIPDNIEPYTIPAIFLLVGILRKVTTTAITKGE